MNIYPFQDNTAELIKSYERKNCRAHDFYQKKTENTGRN